MKSRFRDMSLVPLACFSVSRSLKDENRARVSVFFGEKNTEEDLFAFTRHPRGKIWSGHVQEGQALWLPAGFLFTDMMCSAVSGGGPVGCAGLRLCGVSTRGLERLENLRVRMVKDDASTAKPEESKNQIFYQYLSAISCSLSCVFLCVMFS